MPMDALCEIEVVGASAKAARILGVEGEEGVVVAEGGTLPGAGAKEIRWPCGYEEERANGPPPFQVDGKLQGKFDPKIDVVGSLRGVQNCAACVWCVARRKEGAAGEGDVEAEAMMRQVTLTIYDCVKRGGLRLSAIAR